MVKDQETSVTMKGMEMMVEAMNSEQLDEGLVPLTGTEWIEWIDWIEWIEWTEWNAYCKMHTAKGIL